MELSKDRHQREIRRVDFSGWRPKALHECHQFRTKDENATAPNLTGYGSREWLISIIGNPAHERFYGKRNDRMPAFGFELVLDAQSIGLIADWLRGEWYEPMASK